MFKKGLKINSILKGVCPRCHRESMYKIQNPYKLSNTLTINDTCNTCQLRYRLEPSFFYGAMYVSYAVSIAFSVAAFVISRLLFNSSLTMAFISIVVTLIIFMPIIMRLSRNIWINIFVHYDTSYIKKT